MADVVLQILVCGLVYLLVCLSVVILLRRNLCRPFLLYFSFGVQWHGSEFSGTF
jgi:hypothetical protein